MIYLLIQASAQASKVIYCIAELFTTCDVKSTLLKRAYDGITALLIDGGMLRTLCHLSTHSCELISAKSPEELRRAWEDITYFIINKVLMVLRDFLAKLSMTLSAAKQKGDRLHNSKPSGGTHIILLRYSHRFPPGACSLSTPLTSRTL